MSMGHLRETLEDVRAHADGFSRVIDLEEYPKAKRYLDRIRAATTDFLEALETGNPDRHEARNHLNHLSGPNQLLHRQLKGKEHQSFCEGMTELIDRCLAHIDADRSQNPPEPSVEITPRELTEVESARILVAEDDPENGEFLQEVLMEEGHEVELITDGAATLRRLEEADFDLILLDLGLPGADGFSVLEQMGEKGMLNLTPVIVVTGRSAIEHAVRSIEAGAEDFIPKPVKIELLRARVNSSLEKKRLREREFTQFFPRGLAREFARHPDLREMDGKLAEVSVLFCDIRGFSRISEQAGAELTVRWLRSVMELLSSCVLENQGVLVDYAGDEIMAMWGAPLEVEDHAVRACDTALRMLNSLPELDTRWADEIGGITNVGIGINSGLALVGNVGTSRKFKYGPLGNEVNLASRIQGATRHLNSDILISSGTRRRLPKSWRPDLIRRLCTVRVHNISEPVELFELVQANLPDWTELRAQYENALVEFENGNFRRASASLGSLMMRFPDDGPALLLLSRVVEAMMEQQEEFEPIWELPGK